MNAIHARPEMKTDLRVLLLLMTTLLLGLTGCGSDDDPLDPAGGGTFWVCSEKTYDFVSAPSEYAGFNPNHNIVYPGNLLQGATLQSDTPEKRGGRDGPGPLLLWLAAS